MATAPNTVMVEVIFAIHPLPEILKPHSMYMVASEDGDLNKSYITVTGADAQVKVKVANPPPIP